MRKLVTACFLMIYSTNSLAFVIDSHFHPASPENWDRVGLALEGPITSAQIIPMLDEAQVDQAVLLSLAYLLEDPEYARLENDFVSTEVARFPERLIGFCGIMIQAAWAEDEVKRCLHDLNMIGLKLHLTANRLSLRDDDTVAYLRKILAAAEEGGAVAVVIDWEWLDSVETKNLFFLATQYPRLNVILPHGMIFNYKDLGFVSFFADIFPKLSHNVYLDLSVAPKYYSTAHDRDAYLLHLRKFGIDRLFFGSDYPVVEPLRALEYLE